MFISVKITEKMLAYISKIQTISNSFQAGAIHLQTMMLCLPGLTLLHASAFLLTLERGKENRRGSLGSPPPLPAQVLGALTFPRPVQLFNGGLYSRP